MSTLLMLTATTSRYQGLGEDTPKMLSRGSVDAIYIFTHVARTTTYIFIYYVHHTYMCDRSSVAAMHTNRYMHTFEWHRQLQRLCLYLLYKNIRDIMIVYLPNGDDKCVLLKTVMLYSLILLTNYSF